MVADADGARAQLTVSLTRTGTAFTKVAMAGKERASCESPVHGLHCVLFGGDLPSLAIAPSLRRIAFLRAPSLRSRWQRRRSCLPTLMPKPSSCWRPSRPRLGSSKLRPRRARRSLRLLPSGCTRPWRARPTLQRRPRRPSWRASWPTLRQPKRSARRRARPRSRGRKPNSRASSLGARPTRWPTWPPSWQSAR